MFKIEKIINGNTIQVSPNWDIGSHAGDKVIVRGYSPIISKKVAGKDYDKQDKAFVNEFAMKRLSLLLENKFVKLKIFDAETSDCVEMDALKCRVYLDGTDVSFYFPDFEKEQR